MNYINFYKMKNLYLPFILSLVLYACTGSDNENSHQNDDTPYTVPDKTDTIAPSPADDDSNKKTYSNERFKEVTVDKIDENTYEVSGKAQVFEGTLSYVVEDGHYELAKGFTTTDAGAPAFGDFNFTVDVEKREKNSTLMLILFESSPKDGSRTHELVIPLESVSL